MYVNIYTCIYYGINVL